MKPETSQFASITDSPQKISKASNLSKLQPSLDQGSLAKVKPRLTGGKFGKSKRGDLFNLPATPGPGRYLNTVKSSGPSFSFASKKAEKVLKMPGPGTYTPRLIESFSVYKIGKARRGDYMQIQNTPGPGQYELGCSKDSHGWTFSQSKDSSFMSQGPGPGHYNPLDLNKSTGGASNLAKRIDPFLAVPSPGPADYLKNNTDRGLGFSFTRAVRSSPKNNSPGPGKYSPIKLSHSFSAVFGKSNRETDWQNETPRASGFSPITSLKTPGFSLNLKIEKPGSGLTPTIQPPEKLAERVFCKIQKNSLLKSAREKEVKPGPGQYNLSRDLATGKFFSSKSKKETTSQKQTPGPGQYNI